LGFGGIAGLSTACRARMATVRRLREVGYKVCFSVAGVGLSVALFGPYFLKSLHDNFDVDAFGIFMLIALARAWIILVSLLFAIIGCAFRFRISRTT
jgi:hypothetical protein